MRWNRTCYQLHWLVDPSPRLFLSFYFFHIVADEWRKDSSVSRVSFQAVSYGYSLAPESEEEWEDDELERKKI